MKCCSVWLDVLWTFDFNFLKWYTLCSQCGCHEIWQNGIIYYVLFTAEWRQGSPLLLTWAEMSTVVLDYKASVKILFVNCLIFQRKKFGLLWYLWMCAACSRTTFTGDQLCLCLKGLVGFSNTVYHDNNTTKKKAKSNNRHVNIWSSISVLCAPCIGKTFCV